MSENAPGREDATPDDVFIPADVVEGYDENESDVLFEGDTGTLTLDQRRCLVLIFKKPHITGAAQPKEWATLMRDSALIRSRLHELFLDLVIDKTNEVAYKVQVREDGSTRFPPLLRRAAYSREETVLLVALRRRFHAERGTSEQVYVDRDEMLEVVEQMRPSTAGDEVGDSRRAGNAIESLFQQRVLTRTGETDRFAISPVIETLLPVGRLQEVLDWFQQRNASEGAAEQDLAESQEVDA